MGLEIDFRRVETYQRSNRRGLSSTERSRGKVTAIGQVNDAGKEKRVVGAVVTGAQLAWKAAKATAKIVAIDAALTKAKETETYKKAEQAVTKAYKTAKQKVTKAYKTAKQKVTKAYKKAKAAIRNTNSRRFSSSRRRSSSSSSGSSSSSSSSGGGGWWRR